VTDFQRIKLQEIEERRDGGLARTEDAAEGDDDAAAAVSAYNPRVPRTFDVEVRGAHLVDQCIAGDVATCVGEVKMMQVQ
jgi:hypothetical protein